MIQLVGFWSTRAFCLSLPPGEKDVQKRKHIENYHTAILDEKRELLISPQLFLVPFSTLYSDSSFASYTILNRAPYEHNSQNILTVSKEINKTTPRSWSDSLCAPYTNTVMQRAALFTTPLCHCIDTLHGSTGLAYTCYIKQLFCGQQKSNIVGFFFPAENIHILHCVP